MDLTKSFIAEFGFKKYIDILNFDKGLKNRDISVIYLILYKNNTIYIGQTKHFSQRMRSHYKNNKCEDALGVFYLKKSRNLRAEEKRLIAFMEERNITVRNRDCAISPVNVESKNFNDYVDGNFQKIWLSCAYLNSYDLWKRRNLSSYRNKNEESFFEFENMFFYSTIKIVFMVYISKIIPKLFSIEGVFWNICFRKISKIKYNICIYVYWQESLYFYMNDNMPGIRITVSKSKINKETILNKYDVDFWDQELKSAGSDQTSICVESLDIMLQLLEDDDIVLAARDLVLRCMNKGASQWARNHQPWVIDYFFDPKKYDSYFASKEKREILR